MVTLQSLLRDKAFYRDVAQLVAHYVRDVGVGRSSRLIPTEDIKSQTTNGVLIFYTETKAQERRAQRTKDRPSGIVFA